MINNKGRAIIIKDAARTSRLDREAEKTVGFLAKMISTPDSKFKILDAGTNYFYGRPGQSVKFAISVQEFVF